VRSRSRKPGGNNFGKRSISMEFLKYRNISNWPDPLQLPPNCRDVTAEKIGTVIGIVGATAAKATKPG
jgi:hypothetical protein